MSGGGNGGGTKGVEKEKGGRTSAWYHTNHPGVVFPVMAAWAITGYFMTSLTGWRFALAFYFGVLWESWLEFGAHRWILHFPLWFPRETNPRIYHVLHGHHHTHPDRRQFFPLLHNQLLHIFSVAIFKLGGMDNSWMWGVACGGSTGLMIFEAVHWWIHQGISQWWVKPMEAFHITHHQKSKKVAYGFVTPFWDWCFGTTPEPDKFPYPVIPLPVPILPFIISAILQELRGGVKGKVSTYEVESYGQFSKKKTQAASASASAGDKPRARSRATT